MAPWRALAAGAVWALLAGALCAGCSPRQQSGSIAVLAAFSGPADAVQRVSVQVLTPKLKPLEPPVGGDLSHADGRFSGLFTAVPPGTFLVTALGYDSTGRAIFSGQGLAAVTAGSTTLVLLTLQRTPPVQAGPVIESLSAGTQVAAFGELVALSSTVTDRDPAQVPTLQWAWSASAGAFLGPANKAAATWQAPAGPDARVATLTLTASDAAGLSASASLQIVVGAGAGSAQVSALINSWPILDKLAAQEEVVPLGGLAHLSCSARDPDGDALRYTWSSAGCDGFFLDDSAPVTAFQFSAAAQGSCKVSVRVDDGRGGSASGTLILSTGPAGTAVLPLIDRVVVSDRRIFDGSTARIDVFAHEPGDASATLQFVWTAHNGVLTSLGGSSLTSAAGLRSAPCSGPAWAEVAVSDLRGGPATVVQIPVVNCARTCLDLKERTPSLGDGVYPIDPAGTAGPQSPPLQAFCEMSTDGGGWTFFAHHDATSSGLRWFDAPVGTYLANRQQAAAYSLGDLPLLAPSELMVAIDAASPADAAASGGLLLFSFAEGAMNFTRGPLPCAPGVPFGYRKSPSSAALYSANWSCSATSWQALDQSGAALLGLGWPGVYAGPALGGAGRSGRAAWFYAR
jgi:hypothetical protein